MGSRLEKIERVALYVVLVLIGVALLIGMQAHLQGLVRRVLAGTRAAQPVAGSGVAAAVVLGFLFGLIGCPVCGVPLAACVSLRNQSVRYALLTTGLFNLGRLVSFLAVGVLAWLGIRTVQACAGSVGALAAFCGVGILLMFIGIELFTTKPAEPCAGKGDPAGPASAVKFLFWGVGVGVACGSEALAFILPAWASTATLGLGGALLILSVFCVAAFVPITVLVLAVSCSVGVLQRVLSPRLFVGLKYVCGGFVMLVGTQFICAGVRGLAQL